MDRQPVLDFYAAPGRFTAVDPPMPGLDVARAVEIVQGLLVYDAVATPFYGVQLGEAQAEAIHERDSERLLGVLRTIDDRPLTEARPPEHRVGARCHAFSRLTAAMLRAAGVPARARCGFGAYFRPGWLEDHWVAEYWDAKSSRWQMVDAQLDDVWRDMLGAGVDPLAITSEQFLTAGHAWRAWRRGELDAARCGLHAIGEHGPHWIAGNLRLDLAALNKVEMLPWDVWGEGWEPGQEPTDAQLGVFDAVAEVTVDPDGVVGPDALRMGHRLGTARIGVDASTEHRALHAGPAAGGRARCVRLARRPHAAPGRPRGARCRVHELLQPAQRLLAQPCLDPDGLVSPCAGPPDADPPAQAMGTKPPRPAPHRRLPRRLGRPARRHLRARSHRAEHRLPRLPHRAGGARAPVALPRRPPLRVGLPAGLAR